MATYRDDDTPVYREDGRLVEPVVVRRRSGGGFLIGLLLILAIIVALLFFSGFWSADVSQHGSLPKINVSTTPGTMPKVNLESKSIVIGSKQETVAVPTVGVKDKHEVN